MTEIRFSSVDSLREVWRYATERSAFHGRLCKKLAVRGKARNGHKKAADQWSELARAADAVLHDRLGFVRELTATGDRRIG